MNLPAALVYLGFFSCVLGAVYITSSPWCLWALLLIPSFKYSDKETE